jgi:hypothetical protein
MTNEKHAVDHTRKELKRKIHALKDELLAIADDLERQALAASITADQDLAEQPVGPTDAELLEMFNENDWNRISPETFEDIARTVLARWGQS